MTSRRVVTIIIGLCLADRALSASALQQQRERALGDWHYPGRLPGRV